MEKEVKLSKIPYCDCFTARSLYVIERVAGGKNSHANSTKITFKICVNFLKSTIFKSRIISGSLAENAEYWKDIFVP